MVHTLLPRSTGLHHVLRTLAPRIPNLDVIDLTVAYPGIPYRGIPQEFYTLRSIFGARIPPPTVHIHVRRFKVDGDIPVGDLPRPRSNSQSRRSSRYDKGKDRDKDRTPVEIPVPEKERRAFEEWLRTIWREKDELFEHYYVTGRFAVEGQKEVIIPVKLRGVKQYMDAFCFFAPVVVWRVVAKLRGA
jgi:lysocardiolipin and lysophospholipid acyltransferase